MIKRDSIVYPWFIKPYSFVLTLCVLLLLISGVALFIGHEHYKDAKNRTLQSDRDTARLLSNLIREHEKAALGLLQSYALRPSFIDAVEKWDSAQIVRHIAELKENNNEIDLVFVTDKKGVLRVDYPYFKEIIGVNLSYRDWYKSVSKEWKPYVSRVFKMVVGDKKLALVLCTPIMNTRGEVIGILGTPQRTTFFREAVRGVPLDAYQKVALIDQAGQVVDSNTLPYTGEIYHYPDFSLIQKSLREHTYFMERKDPHSANGAIYTTLAPLNGIGWTVVAERNSRDILRAQYRYFASRALFSFLVFSIISLSLFSMRKSFLLSETTALLAVETRLKEEKEKFVDLIENIGSGVAVYEARNNGEDFILKEYNAAAEMLDKTPREEVIGKSVVDVFPGVKECGLFDVFKRVYRTGVPERQPITFYKDEKISWWRENYVYKLSSGEIVALYDDLTKSKLAEEGQKAMEDKYRDIVENAVEGIFQSTPEGRYITANPALARIEGYDTPEELIEGVADLSKQVYVNPEDRARYTKLLEEEEGIVQGFETQHYRKDGSIIWVSINARTARDRTGKVLHYEGTVEDITDRKSADEVFRQNADKLRQFLVGTIKAISMMVETRDPYTAGHQRRVSTLARAIAQDMELPKDTADSVRTAGVIHDLGKISLPAEILSKPGTLTDIEMSLIQVHPQSGYDILKDLGLPYPIAEMVLQHHERLDGSGYPQGLKNGQILLESQIIAVADVVESMASHRPYRPALGIDAALEEIEKNKGVLYDAAVVEACVKLFREKGFNFE